MMRYTGTKYTNEEAEQICRETRVRLRLYDEEKIRQRDRAASLIYKTIEDARVR
jgi:hypothetical protein